MAVEVRAAAIGAGAGLSVAFPAVLIAQIVDSFADDRDTPPLVWAMAPLVLVGVVIAGVVAARGARSARVLAALLAGLVTMAVVLIVGAVRQAASSGDVAWATIPATLALGGALSALGGVVANRTARTTTS